MIFLRPYNKKPTGRGSSKSVTFSFHQKYDLVALSPHNFYWEKPKVSSLVAAGSKG